MVTVAAIIAPVMTILNGTELTVIYQSAMVHAFMATAVHLITVLATTTLNGLDLSVIYLYVM